MFYQASRRRRTRAVQPATFLLRSQRGWNRLDSEDPGCELPDLPDIVSILLHPSDRAVRGTTQHCADPGRRPRVRRHPLLQSRVADSHPQHRPSGRPGNQVHPGLCTVFCLHSDALRIAHRPVLLAKFLKEGSHIGLLTSFDRTHPGHRRLVLEEARLRHRCSGQMASGAQLGPQRRQSRQRAEAR